MSDLGMSRWGFADRRGSNMRWAAAIWLALLSAGCSLAPATPPNAALNVRAFASATVAERAALAPSGVLRVGVYRGSPSSYVDENGTARGVGYLLGQALAAALQVPFEPVVYARNAEVLAAVQSGAVDLVFTNATADRTRVIDFSTTLLDVPKSILVRASAPYADLAALQGQRVRIGVSTGSSTGAELVSILPVAELVTIPTLQQASTMLNEGRIMGFATNNSILQELATGLPGSRVLPSAWGSEHFALGIPKGRDPGRTFIERFATWQVQQGALAQIVDASRMRGAIVSPQLSQRSGTRPATP